MLTEDDPLYPNWDQDETAIADRYGEQDPATVARSSARRGHDRRPVRRRHRRPVAPPGRRSDGAQFTIETFARYFIHDPVHHLYDVTGVRYLAG